MSVKEKQTKENNERIKMEIIKISRSKKIIKNEIKNQKGITLLVLVITIVVLLILAGVTIATLNGENGILTRAQEAKEKTEEAAKREEAELADLNSYIDNNGAPIYDTETGANNPVLSSGMIPVKYDTEKENWVICSSTDKDWYDYSEDNKQWANVMLSDGKYYASGADVDTTNKTLATAGTIVAEEDLGSMFVWIPRYAYKITSGYHSNTNGEMDVKFLIGRTDKTIDNSTVVEYNAETTNNYTQFPDGYVVHPAFQNGESTGYQNGEWKSEILGIWVAKFQAGIKTTENDTNQKVSTVSNYYYPIFKGRKFAYNYVTESQCYDLSLSLDDSGNPYGLTSSSNSHLMKSSEWGAVAYLSISQYGYSDGSSSNEKAKNNLSIVNSNNVSASPVSNPNNDSSWKITAITGYSATSGKSAQNVMTYTDASSFTDSVSGTNGTSYAWNYVSSGSDTGDGTKSSTTGNIYGIYDMGGCLADYTASYINAAGNGNLTTYGGSFAKGTSTYLATAYPYQTDSSITYPTDYKDFNSAYPGFGKIFGDALWETSSGTGSGKAWFGQTLEEDGVASEVFFPRGGYWYSTVYVGLCGLYDVHGNAYYAYGFHSVLVVE